MKIKYAFKKWHGMRVITDMPYMVVHASLAIASRRKGYLRSKTIGSFRVYYKRKSKAIDRRLLGNPQDGYTWSDNGNWRNWP